MPPLQSRFPVESDHSHQLRIDKCSDHKVLVSTRAQPARISFDSGLAMLLGGLAECLGFGLKGLKPEIPESFGIAFR